jgi:hypothetical protein
MMQLSSRLLRVEALGFQWRLFQAYLTLYYLVVTDVFAETTHQGHTCPSPKACPWLLHYLQV